MRHMDDETRERLWEAVSAKADELRGHYPHSSSSRSIGWVSCDGLRLAIILKLCLLDGSNSVFHITAGEGQGPWRTQGKPQVEVDRWFHNDEEHWERRIGEAAKPEVVVVDHTWYRIGKDAGPLQFRGFGGRRWHIRFHDGRESTTRDLWHGGVIPPVFRDRLPDNAVFVAELKAVADA